MPADRADHAHRTEHTEHSERAHPPPAAPPPAGERLWTDRRWLLYASAAAAARLPGTMLPLGLVLAGQSLTGSFASGSVVAGAYAAAVALSAPWRGRRLDRAPLPGGLTVPLVCGALLLAAVGAALAVRAPVPVAAALAAGAAVATAGVPGGLRSLLPLLWGGRAAARAFAGDSAVTEITWIAGPALAAALFAQAGPVAPVACAAVLWLVAVPAVRRVPGRRAPAGPVSRERTGGLLRAVWPLLLLSLGVGVNLGALDVGLPALLHSRGSAPAGGGLLIAALSLSSALAVLLLTTPVAGRLLGGGTGGDGRGIRRTVVCHACYGLLLLPLALLPPLPGALAVVLAAGCFLGPGIGFTFALVPERVAPGRHGEAFGLFFSTNALGTAAGALAAGALVEHVSVSAGLLLAALPPAVAAAVAAVTAGRTRRPADGDR
ncbi:hypothetical protein V1L54_26315 [Streptomyces sp. TRM 70361]|uniref:hypothetical protein n=1 Tax=Streptomyces sp. TRM 70361 TaxID=3116553 RepID=UPI002E7B7084|nr:hypothetical protein [Streptomyces sp. TRM 70361]MEE1942884.1 hypothetical protein [Streptomyces sp. TRM 70361]